MILMRNIFQILLSDWSAIQNWIVFLLRRFGFIKLCIQYIFEICIKSNFILVFLLADSFWGDLKINWVVSTACTRTQLTQEKGRA